MWISKRKYEEMVKKIEDSEMDAKYWKESFEEMFEKYLTCLTLLKNSKSDLQNKA